MKKCIGVLAYLLVVIGALNWGLWGFFQFDLVAWLFKGNTSSMSRLIYGIIGVAGLWMLSSCGRCCKAICCKSSSCCSSCKCSPCSCGTKSGGGCCGSKEGK